MDYELEELVPIVKRLAEKYSAYERTADGSDHLLHP